MAKDKPKTDEKTEEKEPVITQKLLISVFDDNRIVYNSEPEMTEGAVWTLIKAFKKALEG